MSNIQLSDISSVIDKELARFDELYKKSIKSNISLVDLVSGYVLRQKGKKIRPLLVLLSGNVSGGINDRTYRGAMLVELLHSATLIHDDVVDASDKRRGLPSINAVWKNKIAVLMGDYFLARGLLLAVDGGDHDFLGITANAVKRMSEGELLQIGKTRKLDIDEKTYFRIISDKTASLLSTCCEIGAVSATDDPAKREAMKNFGEYIGIAFQIRDDILDYIGSSSLFGKPVGGDIKEKKITLPLIYSLRTSGESDSSKILKMLRNGSSKKDNVKHIIEFVKDTGGIDYAVKTAGEYTSKAKDLLSIFPDSPGKSALENLVDFITERKN